MEGDPLGSQAAYLQSLQLAVVGVDALSMWNAMEPGRQGRFSAQRQGDLTRGQLPLRGRRISTALRGASSVGSQSGVAGLTGQKCPDRRGVPTGRILVVSCFLLRCTFSRLDTDETLGHLP